MKIATPLDSMLSVLFCLLTAGLGHASTRWQASTFQERAATEEAFSLDLEDWFRGKLLENVPPLPAWAKRQASSKLIELERGYYEANEIRAGLAMRYLAEVQSLWERRWALLRDANKAIRKKREELASTDSSSKLAASLRLELAGYERWLQCLECIHYLGSRDKLNGREGRFVVDLTVAIDIQALARAGLRPAIRTTGDGLEAPTELKALKACLREIQPSLERPASRLAESKWRRAFLTAMQKAVQYGDHGDWALADEQLSTVHQLLLEAVKDLPSPDGAPASSDPSGSSGTHEADGSEDSEVAGRVPATPVVQTPMDPSLRDRIEWDGRRLTHGPLGLSIAVPAGWEIAAAAEREVVTKKLNREFQEAKGLGAAEMAELKSLMLQHSKIYFTAFWGSERTAGATCMVIDLSSLPGAEELDEEGFLGEQVELARQMGRAVQYGKVEPATLAGLPCHRISSQESTPLRTSYASEFCLIRGRSLLHLGVLWSGSAGRARVDAFLHSIAALAPAGSQPSPQVPAQEEAGR